MAQNLILAWDTCVKRRGTEVGPSYPTFTPLSGECVGLEMYMPQSAGECLHSFQIPINKEANAFQPQLISLKDSVAMAES